MPHVALLGDSIFDNAAYVGAGRDVIGWLRTCLPPGWSATLGAVDGSTTHDVKVQLEHLPNEVDHFVVSAGGNDAIQYASVLSKGVSTVSEALEALAPAVDLFRHDYRRMLETVRARKRPVAVCTVYDPRFPDPVQQTTYIAALAHFNDAILREAVAAALPVLDLRSVCPDDGDFANGIEPSVKGGGKIAHAIAGLLRAHDFAAPRTVIFGGSSGA